MAKRKSKAGRKPRADAPAQNVVNVRFTDDELAEMAAAAESFSNRVGIPQALSACVRLGALEWARKENKRKKK